jgi:hypothetical protein
MPQSAEIKDLAKALAAAQSSLNAAKKDATNPHFRNQYATLQSVWDAAREVLAPNGLSIVQTFEATDGHRLDLTTTLLHTSGQWIAGTISMTPSKADPQGAGSAATYARRYSLAAILGIVADEDDDGEAASRPPVKTITQAHKEFIETRGSYTPSANMVPPPAPPKPVQVPRDHGNDNGWRAVTVPPFIKKYAGQTLGDMAEKDLLWWAGNYTPKEFKGSIPQKDLDFRAALDAAQAEKTGESRKEVDDPEGGIPF